MTTTIELQGYGGSPIRSFTEWDAYAMPPERKVKHWKEGRSAFELGRIWTLNGNPAVPVELGTLLKSHAATRDLVIRSGITEYETRLPFGNRGPRCHDLALVAEDKHSAALISIEAKADESFGGTVTEELRKARKRPVTRFPERLDWLTRSILGVPAFDDDQRINLSTLIASLPYQLFAAIAGTLLEAERHGAYKAVFVVHEFRTPLTTDAKMNVNSEALDRFLRLVLQKNGAADQKFALHRDQLVGPVPIVKREFAAVREMPCHVPLYIGKIRTDRTAPTDR